MKIVEIFSDLGILTVPLKICYNVGKWLLHNTFRLYMASLGGVPV